MKNSIIVEVRGGLGNQFFIYATGFALSRENNKKLILDKYIYSTSYFLRDFKLCDYNIFEKNSYLENEFLKSHIYIYKIINRLSRFFLHKVREKKEFGRQEFRLKEKKNYYLEGYWQNFEYFDQYKELLKKQFELKLVSNRIKEKGRIIKNNNFCAIHVRRGDYVGFKGGKCLKIDYYRIAMGEVEKKAKGNVKFLIFSDDINYCKNSFKNFKNVFFNEDSSYSDEEELYLMQKCKYLIIANSTFSWWAAYLANSNIVVCPVVDMWRSNFYPQKWIKINTEIQMGE